MYFIITTNNLLQDIDSMNFADLNITSDEFELNPDDIDRKLIQWTYCFASVCI